MHQNNSRSNLPSFWKGFIKTMIPDDLTIYCDAIDEWTDGYCVAGVILRGAEKPILDEKVNSLKREFWRDKWEKYEIKATDITGRREGFRSPRMKSFLEKLGSIIFDEMRLRVLSLYAKREELVNYNKMFIPTQKRNDSNMLAFFIFINQYNDFLFKKEVKGKIVFDEGNDNFKKLLKNMKEQELVRVFDLCTCITMTIDEIKACLIDSRKENALQIADLFAYTTYVSYAKSPNALSGKIFGKKWLPLPIERLDECYVKPPHNLILTARIRNEVSNED